MVIAQIMGAFISILILVTLFPMIQEQIKIIETQNPNNIGPLQRTLLDLLPLGFALGVVAVAIASVANALRSFGVDETSDGDDDEEIEEEEDKPKPKPHKQTYYEYVKERLAIEKLIHKN